MRKYHHLIFATICCLVLSGNHEADAQQKENVRIGAAADIIFLVDSSWSIGKEHFQLVREFLYDVVKQLDVGGNDFRFGLVQFSGNPHSEFQLNTYHTLQDVLFHISHMPYMGGGTKTGQGLEFLIRNHLTKASGSRVSDGIPQIIIVLTDGRSQDDVALPSSILKSAEVNMFAIGVQDAVEGELKEIASEPLDMHLFNLENFTALHGIVGDLVASIRSSMALEMAGVKGIKDTTAQESADIIFLIDGSKNGAVTFSAIRDFIANLIERLSVGPELIRIGVVMFSDQPRTVFSLNSYTQKVDILDAVKALSTLGGEEANIGDALEFVMQNHFTPSGGSRIEEGVPQILVLISSIESSDDIREGVLAMKKASIFSFSIGVQNADNAELQQIATDASFVFTALDTRNLGELQELLLPNIVGVAQRLILLDAPTILTEVVEVNKRDIVFLIDGSTALGSAPFNAIRDFAAKIINRLEIGPDLIQVAVAQYADTVRPEFYFNSFQMKKDIVTNVRKIKPVGGATLNTGSALRFVKNNFFTSAAGARIDEGVLPMLILITGGVSKDDVVQPAQEVKRNGIVVLAVGARNADRTELEQIAYESSMVFTPTEFRTVALTAIIPDVLSPIRSLPIKIVEIPSREVVNKRDIVFLLDGSVNVGNTNLPFVRDFLVNLINSLDVGIDDVRIGLVQFSENPKTEFFLNTFLTKSDVLSRLRQLRLQGGSILNTGAALDFVLSNHFTEAGGSRIDERVPQVLVFLAAGPSADAFQEAANALARARVLTFCVGVRNAKLAELQQIAFNPQIVYFKDEFSSLAALPQEMISPLTTYVSGDVEDVTITSTENKIDILFLIDGSANLAGQFPAVREFVFQIISDLNVGPDAVRVALAQFSDNVQVEFNFDIPSKTEILQKVRRMRIKGGRLLNIGAALDYAINDIFVRDAGSRIEEGVPQFLVLLVAGRSDDTMDESADALKQAGVVTFVIQSKTSDPVELERIVYAPQFILKVDALSNIGDIQPEIVNLLKTVQLKHPGDTKKDVVFLIDGSQFAIPEFPSVREFIERLVNNMNVGSDATRVAVIQFSETPKVEFLLNAHSTKEEVLASVRRLSPKGGRQVNLGSALAYVSKNIFTRPSGSRIEEGAPQFLIILYSHRPHDDIENPVHLIKQIGVAPLPIGKNVDPEEMTKIALSPDYVFQVSTYQDLPSLEQKLLSPLTTLTVQQIRKLITDTSRPPEIDSEAKDIVFLIDSSDVVRQDGLAHIRDFIFRIVQQLDVRPSRVRIAVVQFSDQVFPEFDLKTYSTRENVLQAIRRLRHKGGSPLNVGKALDHVMKTLFIRSAGSRREDGVPQHLVLLLGGRSQDDISRPSILVQNSGINTLGVGTRQVDSAELQRITNNPKTAFIVREFTELPTIEKRFFASFEAPQEPTELPTDVIAVDKKQGDIVFLLDSSINFGRDNFPQVVDFIHGLIDAIYDEGDSIRVGLAQYNSDVSDEFFLKDFSDKERILDAVKKIVYKGGRTASTGAGVKHIQAKHFVKEAGSRKDQNVPQIAVILTAGKPEDDGEAAVLGLSQSGVKVFAVGVKNIDLDEITKLSSDSTTAFRAANPQVLSELNEAVLVTLNDVMREQLCRGVVEVSRDCSLDVILGFDVSNTVPGLNIFSVQTVLESTVEDILNRISQIQKISCTPNQAPTVRVALLAQTPAGVVEAFDFSEYQPELFEKFQALRNDGPYVLTADTLKSYQNKFKSAPAGSTKVVIHLTDGIDDAKGALAAASADLKKEGVKALILVGLERVANFEEAMKLEFGRGFTYNRPLQVNQLDLDFELAEQLDNIAERSCCGVPCKCSGQRGDRGLPGTVGPKGIPGENGYRGYPGDEGGVGDRGPPGINGTQGFQGCPGERGMKGIRGFPGEKGELGEIGLDGIDGEEGERGFPGVPGERGSPGRRGNKGGKGEGGDAGDHGLQGDLGTFGTDSTERGPKGQKGELGPAGEPGRNGARGDAGGIGRDGGLGRRGQSGIKGNKGALGPPGFDGEQGIKGPQGPPGTTGIPGLQGEPGLPGPRGAGGPVGAAGERGRLGPLGKKGEAGESGPKGPTGPPGPRGETGDDGRDGVGKEGVKGRTGQPGFPGYPGPRGVPGDQGDDGRPGPKGSSGHRGSSGAPGPRGQKGESGYPGSAGLKGNKGESKDHCTLVRNIKDKCRPRECPVYPTELAFALDTAAGGNANTFNRMKDAVVSIVNNVTIVESNCPRGARVALVTYNSEVTTEIRFADSRKKKDLVKQIEDLQFVQTSKQRSLETAMGFVARNTFKRARSGFLMRKVAVFFTNGPTRASPQLNEAVLKLYDAGVVPVFLTNREDRALVNALQINNTVGGQAFTFAGGADQLAATIRKVFTCHICLGVALVVDKTQMKFKSTTGLTKAVLQSPRSIVIQLPSAMAPTIVENFMVENFMDVCDPDPSCGIQRGSFGRDRRAAPTDVDIDIAFILDSSESTTQMQFKEIKSYISYIVSQLETSSDPKVSRHHARVAVVQHAPYQFQSNSSISPVKVELSLTDYGPRDKLMDFIQNQMSQLYGTRAVAPAVDYTIRHIFESAPNPRDLKVIVLMMTGDIEKEELEHLQKVILEAKCKGYFFVVMGIGRNINIQSIYSLASEPNDVFFKYADKPSELHEEPLLRFGSLLPSFINSENAFYLSPDIRKQCDWFQADQPVKKFGQKQLNIPNNVTVTPAVTEKLEVIKHNGEVQIIDITENSAKLHWTIPEPQKDYVYDITVTSAHDHSLVVKLNLTSNERVVGGLRSGQKYDVAITGYHNAQAKATYRGAFNTKSMPVAKLPSAAAKNIMVNTEPLEVPEKDPCLLDLDMGMQCKEYQVKWFFDYKNKICTQVWYGGCGGNANRFETEADCISRCVKPFTDICQLKKEDGPCRDFVLKWYFDIKTASCARFWYGGCDGNENRFNTQKDCEKVCVSAHMKPGVVTKIET